MKDFSFSAPNSHEVPRWKTDCANSGRYYIYAHLNYSNKGRLSFKVGNKVVSMIVPSADTPAGGIGGGTISASAVLKLNAGDVVLLQTTSNSELYI